MRYQVSYLCYCEVFNTGKAQTEIATKIKQLEADAFVMENGLISFFQNKQAVLIIPIDKVISIKPKEG